MKFQDIFEATKAPVDAHANQIAYGGLTQPRVLMGDDTQTEMVEYLKYLVLMGGGTFELISTALRSSDKPDIIATINGKQTQFEVKRRSTPDSLIALYSRNIKRTQKDSLFDKYVTSHPGTNAVSFEGYVNERRSKDKRKNKRYHKKNGWHHGFPGDRGVKKIAGKAHLGTDTRKREHDFTVKATEKELMDYLHRSHDDYFIIFTASSGQIDIYDINSTHQIPELKAQNGMPPIDRVELSTYGTANPTQPKKERRSLKMAMKARFTK